MPAVSTELLAHVFARLREVQRTLGIEPVAADDPKLLLADLIDSMGLVELIAVLAGDRGVTAEAVEKAAGHRFDTVAGLAAALEAAAAGPAVVSGPAKDRKGAVTTCWLSHPSVHLP